MARTTEGDLDARGMKFALVVSRFNEHVTRRLLAGAEDFLDRHHGLPDDRKVIHVPGAWELPLAAGKLPSSEFDAIIALGALKQWISLKLSFNERAQLHVREL